MRPIKTEAIPEEWVPIGMQGAGVHMVHTPWNIKGPVINENTGDEHYIADQFSASDVPVREKLAVVGITDLNTVV